MEQYCSQDVKITVRGIKRCARHAVRGGMNAKEKPVFVEAAMKSGIDITEKLDDYRTDVLRRKRPSEWNYF